MSENITKKNKNDENIKTSFSSTAVTILELIDGPIEEVRSELKELKKSQESLIDNLKKHSTTLNEEQKKEWLEIEKILNLIPRYTRKADALKNQMDKLNKSMENQKNTVTKLIAKKNSVDLQNAKKREKIRNQDADLRAQVI